MKLFIQMLDWIDLCNELQWATCYMNNTVCEFSLSMKEICNSDDITINSTAVNHETWGDQ